MKKLIPLLAGCIFLTGCVGINIPTTKVHSYEITDELKPYTSKWNEIPHPIDGKITTESTREWCGPIIWVLIPIPLWLPACENRTEVTFKNDKAVRVERYYPTSKIYACGPYMPFLGASGTSVGLCGSSD